MINNTFTNTIMGNAKPKKAMGHNKSGLKYGAKYAANKASMAIELNTNTILLMINILNLYLL